jgi:hypothetical protein
VKFFPPTGHDIKIYLREIKWGVMDWIKPARDQFGALVNTVINSELLDFWTLSIVRYSRNWKHTTLRKLNVFPSSGVGGKTPTQLGPLKRVNLNHGNKHSGSINYLGILE